MPQPPSIGQTTHTIFRSAIILLLAVAGLFSSDRHLPVKNFHAIPLKSMLLFDSSLLSGNADHMLPKRIIIIVDMFHKTLQGKNI